MKVYEGKIKNDEEIVLINGSPLDPRLDIVNHSPTGFSWGYSGSGPAQLALAILADYLSIPKPFKQYWCAGRHVFNKTYDQGIKCYQQFKEDVIAELPQKKEWIIDDRQIKYWMEEWVA